jgi:hypothetical protein
MNREIILIILVFFCQSLFAQTQSAKGTGIHYFKVEPTMPVNVCYDAEVGIDTSTGFWWEYSRDFGFWIPAGFRIQRVVGCVKPNYTPVDKQSYVVINDCDSLYRWRNGAWWHLNKYTINTDNQDLSIGGNGPTYTIDITNGQGVTIAPGGIIALNESPANTLIISAIEVDGDTTNEIQVIDTFSIVNDTLRLSISKDNEPFKFVNLAQYKDNTDLSYSGTSSPVTLNSSTGADVTITAGTNVTLSATSTNLTINAQGDNWGTQVAQTTARLSGNGTSSNPLDIAQQGATNGQVLKWNGTSWAPAADNLGVTDLSYSGTSSPVTLNSSTGADVTITAGTNVTLSATSTNLTISAQGDNWGTQVAQVTARLSGNGTSSSPLDIAQQGATSGQVLKWNGTSWAPAADNVGTTDLSFSGTSSPVTLNSSSGADVTITAGTNVTLSATSTNLTINATGGDGSETKVQGANGIQVTGTGTTPNPYIVSPPSGSDAQTLRYNGSTLVTSSMLTNNVIGIGINTLPLSPYKLAIKQVTATDGVQIITQGPTNKGLFFGNVSGSSNIYADTFTLKLAAESQIRLEPVGGASQLNQIVFYPINTITSTSSNANLLNLSPRYYPVNPGGNFAYLFHTGEINQTSTSNQDVYMIRSNPNIISLKGQLHGWFYQPAVGRFLWQPNGDTVYSHLRGRLGLGPAATTSTHRLFVDGTMRLTGSTGTATTLMGRNANGEIAAITVGSNLTLSGNTLSATGGGLSGAESGLYVNNNNARLGGTLLENVAIEGGTSEFYLQLRRLNFRYSRYDVAGTNWRQYFSVRGVAANPTTGITPTTDAIAEFGGETSAGNSTKQVLAIGAMATQANGLWLQARNNDTFNIYFPLHINPRGGNVAVGAGASNPAARFTVGSSGLTGTGVAGLTALLYQSEGHGETRLGFGTTVSAHSGAISFRFADDVFRFINLNSTNNTSRIAFSVGGYDAANEKVAFVHTTASSKVRAGFGQTDPAQIHSTVQVAGSLATAYTETTSALTLNETHHTVVFAGTSNVTFTIPTASSCACAGRQYVIHNVSASSVVTLSQSVTKANASTFNTVNAGEWAYIVYGTSTIRGYKLTSN